jgi:peroxiredoxin (alkyl hydroperoxide reductase subunit C)
LPEEMKIGCARPTGGAVGGEETTGDPAAAAAESKKEERAMIKVGGPAPDFTAPAYHKGKFVEVKLSEFKGKWVALCFYPGDFTFV